MAAGCSCNGQRNSICNPQTGTGGGCYPQSTGTINPRPQSSWTSIAVGQNFRKLILDEIKTALNNEFGIRSITRPSWANKNVGDKFGGLAEIRDNINQLRSNDISRGVASGNFGFNSTYAVGIKLTLSGILSLRTNTNVLQATCICNCAYSCTCNCAYNCTCHCAYCNCNCAYYNCTCDCAY